MKILCCECVHAGVLPGAVKRDVLAALSGLDAELIVVADLCGLAAARDGRLAKLAGVPELKIVACHPRAVKWLLHRAGVSDTAGRVEFFNMRAESAEEIVRRIQAVVPSAGRGRTVLESGDGWYPVIDYGRCNKCGQCRSFCLFGVYEKAADGGVVVANPGGCKPNCAACARVCPEVAIIFPKEKQSPIDGAEIVDEDLERSKVGAFKSGMTEDNMRAYLAERRKRALARRRERDARQGTEQ